uniref:Uncharacterized protein n=1 Tax=Chromera velia CCMP2878 TaxID=1169474 RepID=A0A0G4HET1_9ALVE|eukprot:Cvel_26829.t1-p1 / transcript=Cvel_26829.t1 / gene=Cvel_26829 / organism=Chromera_velia_CCMP2878 / gene_product=hypothetical protein / transcript_product=hypothetical protein / location=Cvel_scaffold3251:11002-13793(+) / protein_length=450 / sequence_SO=supercontig / SO=protein_coding / is_pseudo=false
MFSQSSSSSSSSTGSCKTMQRETEIAVGSNSCESIQRDTGDSLTSPEKKADLEGTAGSALKKRRTQTEEKRNEEQRRTQVPTASESPEAPSFASLLLNMHTLVLLDWDDTCLPTSWLRDEVARSLGFSSQSDSESGDFLPFQSLCKQVDEGRTLGDKYQEMLEKIDRKMSSIFTGILDSIEHVRIIVVTHSGGGWVEKSASRFLPKTAQALQSRNIQVVYAPEKYKRPGEAEDTNHKIEAFAEAIEDFYSRAVEEEEKKEKESGEERGVLLNLIGVGDHKRDREALMEAANMFANTISRSRSPTPTRILKKTIKFADCPNANRLLQELSALKTRFDNEWLVLETTDVDLEALCWVIGDLTLRRQQEEAQEESEKAKKEASKVKKETGGSKGNRGALQPQPLRREAAHASHGKGPGRGEAAGLRMSMQQKGQRSKKVSGNTSHSRRQEEKW